MFYTLYNILLDCQSTNVIGEIKLVWLNLFLVSSDWLQLIVFWGALKSPMEIHYQHFPGTNLKICQNTVWECIFPLVENRVLTLQSFAPSLPLQFFHSESLWRHIAGGGLIWKFFWSRLGCEAGSNPLWLIVLNAKSRSSMWEGWIRRYMWNCVNDHQVSTK